MKNATLSSSSLSSSLFSTLRRLIIDVADGIGGLETDLGMRVEVAGFGVGIIEDSDDVFAAKLIEFFGGGNRDNKLDFLVVPVKGTNGFLDFESSSESSSWRPIL